MMSKKGRFIAWTLVALVVFGSPPALWGGRGNPGEKEKHLGEQVLNKATAYLHAKQSADGAWRSETYGLLKSGQSLTPFVLFALTESLTGKATRRRRSEKPSVSCGPKRSRRGSRAGRSRLPRLPELFDRLCPA